MLFIMELKLTLNTQTDSISAKLFFQKNIPSPTVLLYLVF